MKVYRNKYKAICYQTPLGKVITELIHEHFDELVQQIPFTDDPRKVAREALVAMIWGYGMAKDYEEVKLNTYDIFSEASENDTFIESQRTFFIVDTWLETLLISHAYKIEGKL